MNSQQNNSKCVIAVDAMGGDFAPRNAVIGAINALNEAKDFDLILVGRENEIKAEIEKNKLSFDDKFIVNADEVIDMSDTPTVALRTKKDSSIAVGARLVKEGKAHAFVSAGNTGAMMAASTLIIGRIKGVGRPTMGAALPTATGKECFIYDVGASVDSKPEHIFEYAHMGTIYAKEILGIENPKIGLLSVGEEETKGNEVVKATLKLLKNSDLNFVGNVEGRDVTKGEVDIVVCDGFVGNILLKFAESLLGLLKAKMRNYADAGLSNKLKALVAKGVLKEALADMNYESQGGVPLLGVNGISIIGHGSSSESAVKNMVLRAKEMHEKKLIHKIEESLKNYADK